MKKCLLFVALVLSIPAADLRGQSIYYDAIELSKLGPEPLVGEKLKFVITDDQHLKAAEILSKYINLEDSSTYEMISNSFSGNPFFELPDLTAQNKTEEKDKSKNNFFSKGLSSSIGGLPVTTFADGLAQFMIERANEEINVWFFRRFKEDLIESIELRTIFPITNSFIQITEPYQYAQNLHLLREAFKKDLAELVDNLEDLASLEKYQNMFDNTPALKVIPIGLAGASIVSKIKKGIHPANVIDSLGTKEYLKGENENLFSGLRILSILSQSVRNNDPDYPDRAYIEANEFKTNIIDDNIAFKIYLGLIYQQMDNISFIVQNDPISVQCILSKNKKEILASKDFGLELLKKFNKLENDFLALKTKNDTTEVKYMEWYNFYGSVIDIVEFGIDASSTLPISAPNKTYEYKKFIYSAKKGNELFKNVSEKNYSLAVLNFSVLYDTLIYKPVNKEILRNNTSEELKKVPSSAKFIKYASFTAAVADAEKPEDVKAALNAAALPAGSASIKRQTPFNISVNSFLGFHLGDEKLEGRGWGRIRGVSAPVGIAISKGINFPFKDGALSLFGSIIDVGAVASFRLTNNDGVETLPEMKLENIIAPGAYIIYGLPKTPISIGYGWQRGPQLRGITTTTEVEGESEVVNFDLANGYRWNFFIAVDIPLFNLYTRSR